MGVSNDTGRWSGSHQKKRKRRDNPQFDSIMNHSSHKAWRQAAIAIGVALLYFAAARCSLLLAFPDTNASAVWPPTGIALAALTAFGLRLWPAVAIGAFAANIAGFASGHDPLELRFWLASASIALGNAAEAALGAWLLRRSGVYPRLFDSLGGVFRFVAVVLTAAVVSAAVGTASLGISAIAPQPLLQTVAWTWWMGDVCGGLLLAPFALAWADQRTGITAKAGLASLLTLACVLIAASLGIFVAGGNVDLQRLATYLVFPLLATAAIRHGLRGASMATLLVAAFAIWGTTHGNGPFSGGPVNDSLILLDTFLALCATIGLALGADRIERGQVGSTSLTARNATPWGALFVGLGLTVLGWTLVARDTRSDAEDDFKNLSRQIELRMQTRFQDYERVLVSVVGLFAASPSVDRRAWHAFLASQDIGASLPGIRAVGFNASVSAAERDRFVNEARRSGLADYAIVPAGGRSHYAPVLFVEPMGARKPSGFGYDMASEAPRREAMDQARDSGRAVISSRLTLNVDKGVAHPPAGFVLFVPVYRNGEAVDTVAQRRAALIGFVFSTFRMSELMQGILGTEWPEVQLQVFDDAGAAPNQLLFADAALASERNDAGRHFRYEQQTSIFGHVLTLRFGSSPAFEAMVDRQKGQLVFVAGALVSLLLFGTLRAQTLMVERATLLAHRMTGALATSEARYRLLYEASPAMLHSIDSRGTIVFVSDTWLRKMGYTRDEVLGRPSTDFLTAESQARARDVVLPEFFRTGKCENVAYEMVARDGSIVDVLLSAVLPAEDQSCSLAFLDDVTQRRRAEREADAAKAAIREVNERLAAIVESSGDAIISESLDGRVVTWNRSAETLFGYRAEEMVGRKIDALLPTDKEAEKHALLERVYCGEVVRQFHTARVHRNGSRLEVSVTLAPISDAGGAIVGISKVVRDVSIQRLLQESQARQTAILQSAGTSIISTNPRGIIVSFNAAAERMLGYCASELVGISTPAIIHVAAEVQERAQELSVELGTHVPANFEAFVARVRGGGVDQREWTYMRKDGSCLPISLSVTAIRAADGQISGFLGVAIDISARKAHEELQRTALVEKETLLKEVYHRVKNNLQVVSSLFNLQLRALPDGAARDILQESADRVRAMALVHEKLCRSNNLESIDIASYIRELCESLASASGARARGIRLAVAVEPIELGLDASIPLGLLLNELICNSLKHAFAHGCTGTISVQLRRIAGGRALLEVADDGIGFSSCILAGRYVSLGLRLVTTLAGQLDGALAMENRKGAYTALAFPVSAASACLPAQAIEPQAYPSKSRGVLSVAQSL